jgi:hypothetical protein
LETSVNAKRGFTIPGADIRKATIRLTHQFGPLSLDRELGIQATREIRVEEAGRHVIEASGGPSHSRTRGEIEGRGPRFVDLEAQPRPPLGTDEYNHCRLSGSHAAASSLAGTIEVDPEPLALLGGKAPALKRPVPVTRLATGRQFEGQA